MQLLEIAPEEAGQRLDKLLGKYLNQAGKGFLYTEKPIKVFNGVTSTFH